MKTATPVTARKFESLAASIGPCELVKGEIVRTSPGGQEHSRVVTNATWLLCTWARSSGAGQVLTGEAGVLVGRRPDTVRGADVVYVSYKRLPRGIRRSSFLTEPPELIVEVLGMKDTWEEMEEKVAEYLKFGVGIVLIAEPQTKSVQIHTRGAKPAVRHGSDELCFPKQLPGFRCLVEDLFSE
jgi:Uma2 family endonuclease